MSVREAQICGPEPPREFPQAGAGEGQACRSVDESNARREAPPVQDGPAERASDHVLSESECQSDQRAPVIKNSVNSGLDPRAAASRQH